MKIISIFVLLLSLGTFTANADQEYRRDTLMPVEIAQIRESIKLCWTIPKSLAGRRDLDVIVEMWFHKDGSRSRKPVVMDTSDRYSTDNDYKLMVDSVIKALNDPNCSIMLPLGKYPLWRHMIVTFDPNMSAPI